MSDDELRTVLRDTTAAVIAFGHHHVAYTRRLDGLQLVDVSAVGNPKDGDLRVKYGVFAWDGKTARWTSEIVKLDYPIDATIAEMRTSGMPDPEAAIQRLLRASY
jgi:hypothetical protein